VQDKALVLLSIWRSKCREGNEQRLGTDFFLPTRMYADMTTNTASF